MRRRAGRQIGSAEAMRCAMRYFRADLEATILGSLLTLLCVLSWALSVQRCQEKPWACTQTTGTPIQPLFEGPHQLQLQSLVLGINRHTRVVVFIGVDGSFVRTWRLHLGVQLHDDGLTKVNSNVSAKHQHAKSTYLPVH